MSKPRSSYLDVHNGRGRANGILVVATEPAARSSAPELPPIGPDEPAAVAIHRALAQGVERLRASEGPARARDPEGIHKMRTSARRLRSVLRTFLPLLDGPWAEALEEELKWLGHRLGDVRDLDVLEARLSADAGTARAALEPLFGALQARAETLRRALDEALDGARYQELTARLVDAAEHPRLRDEAWEACGKALPRLVRDAWNRLKKRGRDLRANDCDEDFHEVRKRAKAARYAAESVAGSLGRDAERFAARARKVQDILGEHQDAIVAGTEVARIRAMFPDDASLQDAAKALGRRLEQSADESRDRFFKVWEKLDRKKLRRWLHP